MHTNIVEINRLSISISHPNFTFIGYICEAVSPQVPSFKDTIRALCARSPIYIYIYSPFSSPPKALCALQSSLSDLPFSYCKLSWRALRELFYKAVVRNGYRYANKSILNYTFWVKKWHDDVYIKLVDKCRRFGLCGTAARTIN